MWSAILLSHFYNITLLRDKTTPQKRVWDAVIIARVFAL